MDMDVNVRIFITGAALPVTGGQCRALAQIPFNAAEEKVYALRTRTLRPSLKPMPPPDHCNHHAHTVSLTMEPPCRSWPQVDDMV